MSEPRHQPKTPLPDSRAHVGTMSGQHSFGLPENVIRWRPLWPVAMVQIALNLDEYELEKRLQDGSLAWIFDISTKQKCVSEKRVLSFCVMECLGNKIPGITPTANLTLERVIQLILGHNRVSVRSVELARVLFVQRRHVFNLSQAKLLEVVRQPTQRRGPNSSPWISRASVARFLEKRRVA